MWALVFFDTPYSIQKYRCLFQTIQTVPSVFSLKKNEDETFLPTRVSVFHIAKRIWPKTSEKERKENTASPGLAWCQPCEKAAAPEWGAALCRGMGPGWAGQLCFASCFPPEKEAPAHPLEKEHLSYWISERVCPVPCHLRALLLAFRSQPSSVISQPCQLSSLVCRDRESCGPRRGW